MEIKNRILLFFIVFIGSLGLNFITANANDIETYFKVGRNIEQKNNENLDDRELDITFDEFEKNLDVYRKYLENDINEEIKTIDGVEIIETNLKWNGELDLTNNPKTLVLHHIEASRPGQTIPVTDVHQWHLANGWTGIGYHFYITKTGKIYRGRPENAIGAHAKQFNKDSVAIAVEGKYGIENMPSIQRGAVEKLGGYLRGKYNIDNIKGHGELIPTSCPGGKYPLKEIKSVILQYPIYSETQPPNISGEGVQYVSYVENEGWQNWVKNGERSGHVGLARRVEGVKIQLSNINNSNIVYRTHVQDYGWMPWVKNGETSGTKMEAKRIEAIQIQLEGNALYNYDIEYRTHVQDYGWMPWVKNGQVSGTEGESKRVEAIEIRLVEKANLLEYKTHVQDSGWTKWKSEGQIAGTVGERKRIEAISVKINQSELRGMDIKYRTHVQDHGWLSWVKNGEISGTEGQSKRVEAIQINLEGIDSNKYDIEYRTHVQDHGWMPWVKNGEISGTEGQSKRVEALEIRIKRK
ncbi:MAG: N-acetylmuramoyl-L-alanine amidase [Sarcina sp.]